MRYSLLELAAMAYNLSSTQIRLIIDRYGSHENVLAILAARPDLDPVNAAILSQSSNRKIRRRALTKVTDVSLLAKAAISPGYSMAAAANVHTPVDILDRLLRKGTRFDMIRAACNPTTPVESRMKVLSSVSQATKLVRVGSSLGDSVVRSHEMVNNNPWMLNSENFDRHDLNIKRAIIGNHRTPRKTILHASKSVRSSHGWSSLTNHPYLNGGDFVSQPWADLAKIGCAAADLCLVEHPLLDPVTASSILAANGRVHPEPHIVARLARRFGNLCFRADAKGDIMAATRVASASWLEPCVGYYTENTEVDPVDVANVVSILGIDESRWDVFVVIGADWRSSLSSFSEVCSRL